MKAIRRRTTLRRGVLIVHFERPVTRFFLPLAIAGAAWLIYLVYVELRNANHVWHAPCITPDNIQNDVRYVIRNFKEVAEGRGIRWWLDYGTLLGAWRLGRSMPFDHDGDLSYVAEDKPKLDACREALAARGIELNTERGIMFYR